MRLAIPDVPVVALAGFVVVAQLAVSGDDEGQRVFQIVPRPLDRPRHTPYPQFDESRVVDDVALIEQQKRFHVGMIDNAAMRCQTFQHNFPRA